MTPVPPPVRESSVEQILARGAAAALPAMPAVHLCASCSNVAHNYLRGRWLCDPCSAPAGALGISPADTEIVAKMLGDLVDAVAHLDGRIEQLDQVVRETVARADVVLAKFGGGPMGILRTRRAG